MFISKYFEVIFSDLLGISIRFQISKFCFFGPHSTGEASLSLVEEKVSWFVTPSLRNDSRHFLSIVQSHSCHFFLKTALHLTRYPTHYVRWLRFLSFIWRVQELKAVVPLLLYFGLESLYLCHCFLSSPLLPWESLFFKTLISQIHIAPKIHSKDKNVASSQAISDASVTMSLQPTARMSFF